MGEEWFEILTEILSPLILLSVSEKVWGNIAVLTF